MSIDGKWIKKNEVKEFREGPFAEKSTTNLLDNWNSKINEASSLLNKISTYLKMDKDGTLFPSNSEDISLLNGYTDLYFVCCKCDKQNTDSLRASIGGLDVVIDGLKPIYSSMDAKLYGRTSNRKDIFERRRLEQQISIEQLMQAQQIVDDTSKEIDEMRSSIAEIFDTPRRR